MTAEKSTTDYHLKVSMVGDYGFSKESPHYRIPTGIYNQVNQPRVNRKISKISLQGKTIELQIWCLLGFYHENENSYYKDADGIIVVFDITSRESFNHLQDWVANKKEDITHDAVIVLVGKNCDMEQHRKVSTVEAQQFAKLHKTAYIETSGEIGQNFKEAYELLATKIFQKNTYAKVQSYFSDIYDTQDIAKKQRRDKRLPSGFLESDEILQSNGVESDEKVLSNNSEHAKEKKEKVKQLKKSLNKAKKKHGTFPVRILKLVFTGSGAAGKTSFINLLLKREIKKYHHSTNVVHTNHAVSIKKAIFHSSECKVTWTEFDPELEINCLHSLLIPKPPAEPSSATESQSFTERDAQLPIKPVNQYKSPKPHQSAIVQWFTGLFKSRIRDSNLSTFDNIIDATHPKSITYQPGEVLNIITLLDTGGQPEYIHLLPTINIYPTVTFVVHDLSKSLSDQVLVEYSQHGKHVFTPYHLNYSNLDMIKLLMSAANDSLERSTVSVPQLVTTPGTNKKSYICLVGTHADKASQRIKENTERELGTMVNKTHCETAVWSNGNGKVLFSVDNTTAGSENNEDPVASEIRVRIETLAEEKDIYEIPITWMLLELEIRHVCSTQKKAYISVQDCVALAREIKLMSKEEEVKSVLLYHHLLGVLIYFEEVSGLCDYVILDHQWWFDKLSSIICITFQQASLDHQAIQKLKYQGLLSKELLQHVEWKDDIKEEFFLSLLVYMRIIAPVFKEREVEEYFIPFILPTCNFKQNNKLLDQYGFLQGKSLLVHFQSGLLPRGIFCSLIVELLQHPPKGWRPHFSHEGKKEIHHTYSNLISFRLIEGHSLSLLDKVSYLEIQIRHLKRDFNISVHNIVYSDLVSALKEVCTRLNFDHERLQYGFECQCGESIDNHIAVVPDIKSSVRYAVCSIDTLCLLELDSTHLIWFSSLQNSSNNTASHIKPSSSSNDHVIVDSLTEGSPDQPAFKKPHMKLLHEIVVPRIAADWSKVADYLEYEVEYKRIIKERCYHDPERCCVELLEDWVSSDRGVSPKSWCRLIEALKEIKSLTATTEKIIQDLANAGVNVTDIAIAISVRVD